ncbi:PREDICTED: tRNA pseudouridine(38/39) synthase, partial [Buceros rhinoceros silvestris]|uniref:tRNA pseudouridine(38/39) synthase n=1 Tax=Buceros rhinoceros silvestris TaxID=175836 RepID=UPI000529091C
KTRQRRPFDFGACSRRHVALKVAYLGWGYQGFASQENTRNTVEEKLFEALTKTRVANGVVNFQRTILSASVTWAEGGGEELGSQDPFRLYQFEVTGQAFLYHQVRCMMAILFLIGQRMESPEVIDELLDVEKNPRKPQYSMAVEFPLVLYDCTFANLRWLYGRDVQTFNVTHLQQLWAQHAVKAQALRHMLRGLDAAPVAAGEGKGCSSTILWGDL